MNYLILTSGIVALMTTIGHFTFGKKQFLLPTLTATFDSVAKKVMHCVFHYVSTFLVLSAFVLLAVGTGKLDLQGSKLLVYFIATNFAIFAIWQICLAITSGIPRGVFKLFQWVFFVLISVFAFSGASSL